MMLGVSRTALGRRAWGLRSPRRLGV